MKNVRPAFMVAAIAILAVVITANSSGEVKNGFRLGNALVPAKEILSGGPARDGIPAIDKPVFIAADEAIFLAENDRILGITRHGIAKAYPVAILNWHEIVNDRFGDDPVVVSYCPLCGTGMAWLATDGHERLEFGVSGLLYNSDMLLYDRQTFSLWSQIRRQAISGHMKGTRLEPVVVTHTRWADWRQRYPATRVLSTDTGYPRDYSRNPYAGYGANRDLYFPVSDYDDRYHPKEPVLGIELSGRFKAYPFAELKKLGGDLNDEFAGHRIKVSYDEKNVAAAAFDANDKAMAGVTAYWFAWYAFHPETEVFRFEGTAH